MLIAAPTRAHVVTVLILALAAAPVTPLVAQAPAAAKTPAAAQTTPSARPADHDGGWPRAYQTASGAALVVYQPQIASWVDQKQMVAYAAVSYTPKGATRY